MELTTSLTQGAKAQLKPWETVLIFGIGGGVSLAALPLAKLAGAQAIVTSRDAAKLEHARLLGADHLINLFSAVSPWRRLGE